MRQFLTESCYNGKEYPVRGECRRLYVPSVCAILGLDGKWDEDNLCELPGRAITLLREPAEAAVPTAVGLQRTWTKHRKWGVPWGGSQGSTKGKIRRKIKFHEEKHWVRLNQSDWSVRTSSKANGWQEEAVDTRDVGELIIHNMLW